MSESLKPGWADGEGPKRVPNPKTKDIRKAASRPADWQPKKTGAKRRSSLSYHGGTSIEAKFRGLAAGKGWNVHRRGWPDFLITAGGKTMMVEVKSRLDKISGKQKELFIALEAMGITVRVWWEEEPEKLIPWRRFLVLSGFRLRVDQERGAASPVNRNPPRYSAAAVRRMIAREIRKDRKAARELGGRD